MRVLSVRFKSTLPLADLETPWGDVAVAIAGTPGLISKTWIHDGDYFGGIYIFRDQSGLDAYAAGPIVAAITSNPAFSDFRLEQFDVLEGLSATTRGIPAAAARR
ncbi:MAG: YdhR family protein [Thermoflexaceae bacterium]|nr:YdhR family protein [Thermoflexaceae bacterium]